MDGILVVNKEQGFTSHDVVAKLRGILKMKKIGHTGTLDPMATGVLPVCLGAGTKLCDEVTDSTKIYRVKMLLGESYDTEDISGSLLDKREVLITEEELNDVLKSFIGESDQIPPMYSAIKVDGKKLYEYARAGKVIERKPRRIRIDEITVEKTEIPYVTMTVRCSKGTYIRSLCRDIGEKLGCLGCMAELERIYTGGFSVKEAKTLSEIEELVRNGEAERYIRGVDEFYSTLPAFRVTAEGEHLADNGNPLKERELCPGRKVSEVNIDETNTGEKNTAEKDTTEADSAKRNTSGASGRKKEIRVYRKDGLFYGVYRYDDEKRMYVPKKLFFCMGKIQ